MSRLLDLLRIERPVVQAGMGGGIAGHELAGAVSRAGGLGTIGFTSASALAREVAAAREVAGPGKPVAVNLLLPFARRLHWEAAERADVVVTFWGRPRRRTARFWIHQCGSVDEARQASHAGADAVIAQGVEAGGHVRGTVPALELLERVREAVECPVLLAGGIAERPDVERALHAGADAAVLGTRFLMTPESGARSAYKQRLMESRETVLTELFGAGWPRAPHRVLWNEATERWLSESDPRGPAWVRGLHTALGPVLARAPESLQTRFADQQNARSPLLGPLPPTKGGPANLLDSGPLYAGESVARIHDLRPAAELTQELA